MRSPRRLRSTTLLSRIPYDAPDRLVVGGTTQNRPTVTIDRLAGSDTKQAGPPPTGGALVLRSLREAQAARNRLEARLGAQALVEGNPNVRHVRVSRVEGLLEPVEG